MGNQKKEDEKTEKLIRGLLKLPENRRCINCNSLGPQYVCTTFSTFVCTNCSGIHREFTHRVKSVSMAKFTAEEVTALQAGGNERAKQIYFKEWDSLHHPYPDSSNMHKLREFIKHAYVDRKFTGERSQGNLPRIRLNNKEDSYSKKSSSFQLKFRSPQSCPGPRTDDSSFRYVYDESKSPRYVKKYSTSGGFSKSPIKIEVVDDRFRDDDYRNRRLSNLESKIKQLSIEGPKNVDRSQSPVARPSGEKIGENVSSLQVTTSGGDGSVHENPSAKRSDNPESSTNLSTKSQASNASAGIGPETPQMTQPYENNWASFESSKEDNIPITPNTNNTLKSSTNEEPPKTTFANPLDLLLFELSGPMVPTTSGMSEIPSGDIVPITTMEKTNASPSEVAQSCNEASPQQAEPHELEGTIEVSHAHEPLSLEYSPSVSEDFSSATQPINAPINEVTSSHEPSVDPNSNDPPRDFTELSSQTTSKSTQDTRLDAGSKPNVAETRSKLPEPSVSPNSHESLHFLAEISSQTPSKPSKDTRFDVGSKPNIAETRSSGRKELPEDLFSSSFLSGPAPHAGWQNAQAHVMGYGMQYYPNAVPPSALPIASNNPFEVTGGKSMMHASSYPTLASMHGELPAGISPRTGLMHTSSLGSLETVMPQSTSYATQVPSRPTFASGITTGVCFDQVNNEKQVTRSQSVDPFNGDITGFGSLNTMQQSSKGHETPGTPNYFSNSRGNPFE